MAVVQTRDENTTAGNEQTYTLAAADELVLDIGRAASAAFTPINFWIYPDESASASVKVETIGSGRTGAAWVGIENFGALTVASTMSLNTQVKRVRITSTTGGCTVDILSLDAQVERVTA